MAELTDTTVKTSPQIYVVGVAFVLFHVAALGVFYTGVSTPALIVLAASYFVRGFGITAGYHRLLAHRSFQTSRFVQFLFAFAGCQAFQGGPLWWVAHHRSHHRFTETDEDIHSPRTKGLWQSHMGWMMHNEAFNEKGANSRDLHKFPEIKFLQRYYVWVILGEIPAFYGLGVLLNMLYPEAGTSGLQILVWGFFLCTVMLWHATFMVNSVCHMWGSRGYETEDTSTNNVFVAAVALGEGWHNNHHQYPLSSRHGLHWWQIDLTWYLLKTLKFFGLVSNLKLPKEFRHADDS